MIKADLHCNLQLEFGFMEMPVICVIVTKRHLFVAVFSFYLCSFHAVLLITPHSGVLSICHSIFNKCWGALMNLLICRSPWLL